MSAQVSDALGRIERELRALWQPDESGYTKPHATTLNLVALHGQDGCAFLETLEDVAARLGARTFVVSVDGRLEPWALEGEVSAVCRLEPGSLREAVCAERVTLRFGSMVGKRAASILDSLIESSLPTAVFAGPAASASILDALAGTAGALVIDSAELGVTRAAELAQRSSAQLHDLAFIRTRRWREMLARVFDDPALRPALGQVQRVRVEHAERADHRGASAEAELLVAWLAARLGWSPGLCDATGRAVDVRIESQARGGVIPGCMLSVALEAQLPAGALWARVEREADGEHLSWTVESPPAPTQMRRFATPRRDDAELVERAIRSFQADQLLRETLAFAGRWKAHA
ncbi:MAG: glucose-6-phosphate dehydrogenase assembly protein OpcA [Polyangiaceae bacterium]|nr:glucose-6-phosphate dehydrogenase assembly protein OpcA [Polyangiaceae bacterium]